MITSISDVKNLEAVNDLERIVKDKPISKEAAAYI